ncbi:MAG TPA: diguanylate cyclase [Acholeplasmataceae bacterium]|nr:diguanylate cyclase [Acholeplasmataceae bacterium]
MNKIVEFILKNEYLLIPVLLLVLVLFLSMLEKKRKVPWLSLILTGTVLLTYILVLALPKLNIFNLPLLVFVAGYALLVLLVNFVYFLFINCIFYKRLNLVKVAANSTGNKIYAYLNSKAKLINFTEEFANLLGLKKNQKKYYEEAISRILVDSQEMELDVFIHYIRTPEERDYRIVITLGDGKTRKLDLKKRKIISSGKLLGYVLMTYGASSLDASFNMSTLYNYLNFLGEPLCYYDFKSRRYILNREMMDLLGVSDNLLDENNFLSTVVQEDLPIISGRNLTDKLQKLYYRLKTLKGNLWFEESNINFEGHQYLIVHRTDFERFKMKFYDRSALLETAHLVYERNNWLALVLIKITNLLKINQQVGKDVGEVLMTKFFLQVGKELNLKSTKIYRLEDEVFALIIDKKEGYNRLLAILNSEKNFFIKLEIPFNEIHYEIENALGIISSENAEDSRAETLLREGYEALNLAADPKYTQNYSIYLPKTNVNLDLHEMGIDLSDDFLDDILKD